MMDPKVMNAMRAEMEKQAFSGATLSRVGNVAARGARSVVDFGKRQVHGLTGAMGDSLTAGLKRKQVDLARQMEGASGRKLKKLVAKSRNLAQELSQREAARDAGITHLPGVIKGLVTDPKKTGKALWQHSTGGSRFGAGLAVGLPAVGAVSDLRKGDESGAGGMTIGQKAVHHTAQIGTGLLTAGMPFIPGILASSTADTGAMKAYDKLRKLRRNSSPMTMNAQQTLRRPVTGPTRVDQ